MSSLFNYLSLHNVNQFKNILDLHWHLACICWEVKCANFLNFKFCILYFVFVLVLAMRIFFVLRIEMRINAPEMRLNRTVVMRIYAHAHAHICA